MAEKPEEMAVETVFLCDCGGSQVLDRSRIEAATGVRCSRIYRALCTTESAAAAEAVAQGAVIACQQERICFEELAADAGVPPPRLVDLRDRAGWSDEARRAGPKQAALLADALLPAPATRMLDVVSDGRCLITGSAAAVLPAAARLADVLSVTALLPEPPEDVPLNRRFEVICGVLKEARGALGGFQLRIDGLRQLEPGGRGSFGFSPPRDGALSECDVILDLSGGPALFPAAAERDGYLRADPRRAAAVADAVFEAGQMTGTFEKPLHVRLEETLCAHSRAQQTGCSRCLDACPTGALAPAGDHVAVDPAICAGCGACSAVCPSGAVAYDAPPLSALFRRIEVLARTHREAGGAAPRLLVTDSDFGVEIVALAARFGRGLPADVIPLALDGAAQFGHTEMLAALACGFAVVDILPAPRADRVTPASELALAEAMGGAGRLRLLEAGDPDALCAALYEARPPAPGVEPILPLGPRRQIARLAAKALNPGSDAALPLPEGAPYGAVQVDKEACTLCLACVSLCPSGALADNTEKPQLRFQEDACLQCGLCRRVCPESAITLEPRLDLSDAALGQKVLNEEEPCECVECGKPFGVKSTVDRILRQLAGKHAMFADSGAARMIRMCEDCRVRAQFHSQNNPFAAGERPRVRTSDDYFPKREDQ